MNNAALNTGVQILWENPDFISIAYIPRSGIAEMYGSSVCNFLRKFHTVFHSAAPILHSHQQCPKVPFSPHLNQHLLSLSFFLFFFFCNNHSNRCEVIFHCCGFSFFRAALELHCWCVGFFYLWRAGVSLHCGAQASYCGGFSWEAWALGAWASVVAACRLSSWGTWDLEWAGFSSCGSQA